MHIVVLMGYYYPNISAPASCIKPYLIEMAKEHKVEIICPASVTHSPKSIVIEGVTINYVNSWPNKFLSYIKTNQAERKKHVLTNILFYIYRALRFLKYSVCIKPYETSLIKPYVNKIKEIDNHEKIDIIISVTFPFYTHVAALKYKEVQPQKKWITYTTDPLAYSESNPVPKWKLKVAINTEHEVYSKCDKCIVTEALYYNVLGDYNIPKEKVLPLPFLMYNEAFDTQESYNERPRIIYAGYLFYGIRNPRILLEVFSKKTNLHLELYVSGDRQCRKMLRQAYPENIIINGLVPSEEYKKLLSKADVLINLSNDAKLQSPHKLMELISTGKPIINFYYHKDSSYSIIERYPLGINISNKINIHDMAGIIEQFIKDNNGKKISYDEIKAIYPELLFKNQISKFKDVINNFAL